MDDQLFQYMKEDITEMKKDIKSLLQFKWQIMGGTAFVSIIVGVAIQIFIAFIGVAK